MKQLAAFIEQARIIWAFWLLEGRNRKDHGEAKGTTINELLLRAIHHLP